MFGGAGGLVTKSCPTLAIPWNVARQALPSMGFLRQEYWSGLPFPSAGDLPDPEIKPGSPALQAVSSPSELQKKPYFKLVNYFRPWPSAVKAQSPSHWTSREFPQFLF